MLVFKLAVVAFVAAVLNLSLKKDQPAYAFLVSVCAAVLLLAGAAQQIRPVVEWLHTLGSYISGDSMACLLRVLGIALVAQLAGDICREAGLAACATTAELGGRILALWQALPLLQELFASFAGYLQ